MPTPGTWSPEAVVTLFEDAQDMASLIETLCHGCHFQFTTDASAQTSPPLRRKEGCGAGHRSRPSVVRFANVYRPTQRCQTLLRRRAQVTPGKIDDVLCLLGGEPAGALPVVGTLQG